MSVAERAPPVVFAATVKATVPLPVALEPLVIVTHPALLAALHAHPAALVTPTLPVPPPTANASDAADRLNEQAAAAWVTVNV